MSKRIIKDEMLKVNAELSTTIALITPSSVRQSRNKLRSVHRRTRRVLNLLNRRSTKGTTISPIPQVPPVTGSVTVPISKVLAKGKADWVRLRSDLRKRKLSYGGIARSLGKSTRYRGLIYNAIHGKIVSEATRRLVESWAIQNGYSKECP